MDRIGRMFTSKRWIAFMATLGVLVVFGLIGLPPEVVAPLSEGVGWALVAFLGVESASDGMERYARAGGRLHSPAGRPSVPPGAPFGGPSAVVPATLDRAAAAMAALYGPNWQAKVTAAESVGAQSPIVRDFYRVVRGEAPLGPNVPIGAESGGTSLDERTQGW